ncbi:MAG TPA: outer membrane protein transport protein [Polyangia bacterium]|jgi:long-chain fatty acid transport protein
MTARSALRHIALGSLLALIGAAPAPAGAAGFLVYDITGESIGKASAVSASTTEPAAVWYNPAAMAFMPGYQFSAGGTTVFARNHFTPQGADHDIDGKQATFFLPAIFGTARLSDRWAVGLGGFTTFGLGVEWPADWIGRENAIKASIQTFTLNPGVSYRLLPNMSLAAGLQVVRASVDFKNGLPAAIGGGTVEIGGATWGVGGNAGLLWRVAPEVFHAALTYRSRVKLDFTGRADFNVTAPEFQTNPALQDQGGKATITLPDIITAGFMFRPVKKLELTFDANITFWSTYDKLVLDFDVAPTQTLIRNNHIATTLRLGADWTTPVEGLHARAGFIFDQNPSPKEFLAPSLPDANRTDFAIGLGWEHKWFKIDVGYLLVYFLPSKAEPLPGQTQLEGPVGTYNTIAHLLSTTLTFKLDQPKPAPQVVATAK